MKKTVKKCQIFLEIVTILPFNFFFVNFMLSDGLQNYTNLQHRFLHMGSTPPPPFSYTMCKKTSDLEADGFPNLADLSRICILVEMPKE